MAVGVPFEDLGGINTVGAVNVLYGGAGGLSATGNQFWHQNSAGVLDASEDGDSFGRALTAGDLNGNGRDDLAVGVPQEILGNVEAAGAVNVIYGGAGGLSATGNQFWHQNSAGVLDASEASDSFGWAVATGDNNGDARDDLAVGVVGEDVGIVTFAGAVNVLYGGAGGAAATGNQFWHQNSSDVADTAESGDDFGWSLGGSDGP